MSADISEEELKSAIRIYLMARSLFPENLDKQYYLSHRQQLMRTATINKILTADKEMIKKAVKEEITNAQDSLEEFVQELETKRSTIDRDLVEADRAVSAFPNIHRDNLTIKVDGKILSYEIDILSGEVKGFCPGKHNSRGICVRIKEPSSCSSCRRESKLVVTAFPNIVDEYIRKSVQIAINLANDAEIDDLSLLHDMYKIMTCPKCIKERKIPVEMLDKLCDRIISGEEKEARRRKEIKADEHDTWRDVRLLGHLEEIFFEHRLWGRR